MVCFCPSLTISVNLIPFPDEESPETAPKVEDTPEPAPAPSRGNPKKGGGPASRAGKYYSRGGKPQTPESPAAEDPASDNQRKCP